MKKGIRHIIPIIGILIMIIIFISQFQNSNKTIEEMNKINDITKERGKSRDKLKLKSTSKSTTDISFMPKMPSEEARAELGKSSWRLLHTMLSRFPDNPTLEQEEDLREFIRLFSILYPCGECGEHFREMLKKYPIQTSNRKSASMWGCSVHNIVNKRLSKEIYDCSTILEDYDCGCGGEEDEEEEEVVDSNSNTSSNTNEALRNLEIELGNKMGG